MSDMIDTQVRCAGRVSAAQVEEDVRSFIAENFYVPDPAMLSSGMSLLDRGIVDSTGILEVVEFLQSTFGIAVEDDEIVPENLDSIGAIAAYVVRKRS